MASQQNHNVAYFNAPRVNMNNQQETAVSEQPLLVPPQHAQQQAQAVLQQPQQGALPPQYLVAPTGYPMGIPMGAVPQQQQGYMIYPNIPQGVAPQQIPVQYVLQQHPQMVLQQQGVMVPPMVQQAQPVAAQVPSVDIAGSVSSCSSRFCERLQKFKRCCNPRKLAVVAAVAPFVIHALFTPLCFPWFLIIWLVMALVAGVKLIKRKFAALNDDDERKQHKCLAIHALFYAVINSFLVFLNVRGSHFPWALYPVLIWGMFLAFHALRRLAPHKNTGIKKHAIVFVTLQVLLFITWAYAHKSGNDMNRGHGMMPPPPPPQHKPVQPGQPGPQPAPGASTQGWNHHAGHHGGRHHGGQRRFGGHHHGHHGHHAANDAPVAHQAMEQVGTLQAPTPTSAPAQPPQRPQPPQQPPQGPKQPSSTSVVMPQKPRRAIPFFLYIVPSLILTIAFMIHLSIHKKKQREAAAAAAAAAAAQQEQPIEASAPTHAAEQTAV